MHSTITYTKEYEYKIGYICGLYEPEILIEMSKSDGYFTRFAWWKPDESHLQNDPGFLMGLEDGRGDRKEKGLPSKKGDFFAWDISGFPWGTNIACGELTYHDEADNQLYRDPDVGVVVDGVVDHYRLAKDI